MRPMLCLRDGTTPRRRKLKKNTITLRKSMLVIWVLLAVACLAYGQVSPIPQQETIGQMVQDYTQDQ